MKNVMVCVTQQKTCDRLILRGHEILDGHQGELFIIHVAPKDFNFMGSTKEGEALDYLYEKAIDYGANLTVVRSNNILDTLVELVKKNQITHVVLGKPGQVKNEANLISRFGEKISQQAELIIVP